MKRVLKRVGIVAGIVLLLLVAAGGIAANYFYDLALNPHADRSKVFSAPHNTVDHGDAPKTEWDEVRQWFNNVGYTQRQLTSADGLLLNAYVVETEASNDWVIAFHGYMGSAAEVTPGAWRFNEWGYNVLMPEARGCGKSEGDYYAMGWDDRLDALDWIDLLNTEYNAANIYLFGVSMGGAAVMMITGEDLPGNVRAAVEDCGYTSAKAEFAYQLKQLFGLPSFPMMDMASAVARVRAGYWLGEASALEQVKKSKTPTLFIHGSADTFVPAAMVNEVYEAAACEKELYIVEGAGHGGASAKGGDVYWGLVRGWFSGHR